MHHKYYGETIAVGGMRGMTFKECQDDSGDLFRAQTNDNFHLLNLTESRTLP